MKGWRCRKAAPFSFGRGAKLSRHRTWPSPAPAVRRGVMFKLAHLSDPHIGPLPRPHIRELAGKRMLGWLNWNRGRRETHRMDILDQLLTDMHAQTPDH